PCVAHDHRTVRPDTLTREEHRPIIAEACNVNPQPLLRERILVRRRLTSHRFRHLVRSEERVQRSWRELPEYVDENPGVVASVLLDLRLRPLDRDAWGSLRIVR